MTNEEIAVKIQNGNTELYGELWERLYKLIARYINRFYTANKESCISSGITPEDLLQGGYIALVNAVNDFRPDKGYSLSAYLPLHIKNQCREMTGRRAHRSDALKCSVSLETPLPYGEDITLADTVEDPQNGIEDLTERIYRGELCAVLNESIAALPEEHRVIITERFYNGSTYKQAGEAAGVTLYTARKLEFEGLGKMRRDRKLKAFCADTYAGAMHFTGLSSFRSMQASSVELAAEKIESLKGGD